MRKEKIHIGPHVVDVENMDQILFPEDGITKEDLIAYYRRVSPMMLRYVKGRPIMMHRFPQGIEEAGFYQKEVPRNFPDWIKQVSVRKEGGSLTQVVCREEAGLVYLANQECITLQVWLSRIDRLYYPDRMIFDLDPPKKNFELAKIAARLVKESLEEMNLIPFLMTTGSSGLHIVVPLEDDCDFEKVRSFSQDLTTMLAEKNPQCLTTEQRGEKRNHRVFIDTLRNAYAQTGLAPYSVRAKRGAPVAKPIAWSELENPDLSPSRYSLRNCSDWLEGNDDPWTGIFDSGRSLRGARRMLKSMLSHTR